MTQLIERDPFLAHEETAVSVRGVLPYLYRAVDRHGKSVGSLLRADCGMDAAQVMLGNEDSKWKPVVIRCCRSLQYRRARSPRDQTPLRLIVGLEVI